MQQRPLIRLTGWLCAAFLGTAWLPMPRAFAASPVDQALAAVSPTEIIRHIRVLASDDFEGRAPGTAGEEKTVSYLVDEFRKIGLQPGNPNGTFIQEVPLVGFAARPSISFECRGQRIDLAFPREAVVWSRRFVPEVKALGSEVVFVGYGVVAPEYGWDDYKDVDVRGKTILMLINDPAVPDPNDPSRLDPRLFKGNAMTYYGRWTYKYEIATAKGAAAAIIVHQTGPAGYPWAVVEGSNSRENFGLQTSDRNMSRVSVEGWITYESAQKLCAAGGQDLAALQKAALRRDFRPVALDARAHLTVTNTLREVSSRNVVGKVEGSDPKLKNEYIIYTAHWDHLGRDATIPAPGDQIFNGAVDNASGTAALLELAKAFAHAKPRRTILFLSVTAEEKGLLGAKYYATHPLYPLQQTLANINMDSMNMWGRTRDVAIVGVGQSSLEDTLRECVQAQGRVLMPESQPEKGYYFRSDHFEFAKEGVPALYTDEGVDFLDKPQDYGLAKRQEYTARDYHKVTDEIKPDWDLSGVVEDVQLLFRVGHAVSETAPWPEWKPGSEFKARRDAMMKQAGRP